MMITNLHFFSNFVAASFNRKQQIFANTDGLEQANMEKKILKLCWERNSNALTAGLPDYGKR